MMGAVQRGYTALQRNLVAQISVSVKVGRGRSGVALLRLEGAVEDLHRKPPQRLSQRLSQRKHQSPRGRSTIAAHLLQQLAALVSQNAVLSADAD